MSISDEKMFCDKVKEERAEYIVKKKPTGIEQNEALPDLIAAGQKIKPYSKKELAESMDWMIKASGLTTKEIARLLGRSPRTITGYKKGEFYPDYPTVFTMASIIKRLTAAEPTDIIPK